MIPVISATRTTCTYYTNCKVDPSDSAYVYCDWKTYTCCGCGEDPKNSGGVLTQAGSNRFRNNGVNKECWSGSC